MPTPGQDASIERVRQVQPGHFAKHHTDVLLLVGELPDRSGDLGRRKNRGRHLIEQRLEDVVIAPVDQNDVRIAAFQGASRGDPGKSAADDHDPLSPRRRAQLTTGACFAARGQAIFRVSRGVFCKVSLIAHLSSGWQLHPRDAQNDREAVLKRSSAAARSRRISCARW